MLNSAILLLGAVLASATAGNPDVEFVQLTIQTDGLIAGTRYCDFSIMKSKDDKKPNNKFLKREKKANPTWSFTADLEFPQQQYVKIKIYNDGQQNGTPLVQIVDVLANFVQGEINENLMGGGTVKITHQPMGKRLNVLRFNAIGKDLVGAVGTKLCSLLVIQCVPELGEQIEEAKRSEVQVNTKNPTWPEVIIPADSVTSDDFQNRTVYFQVYSTGHNNGLGEKIGEFKETINDLKKAKYPKTYQLGDNKGSVIIHNLQIGEQIFAQKPGDNINEYTEFTDLGLVTAIDFTGSNGDPKQQTSKPEENFAGNGENSLHFFKNFPGEEGRKHSVYSRTIEAVAGILVEFDTDGYVPTTEFGGAIGGQVPPNTDLKDNDLDPRYASGVDKVYREAVQKYTPWGGTFFAPLVEKVIKLAEAAEVEYAAKGGPAPFFTLLIVTDGVISEIEKRLTIDQIVLASRLPIAIIIACVGDADFTAMKDLDGDGIIHVHSDGITEAEDDCVQHVPITKTIQKALKKKADVLAAIRDKVLKEFPDQFRRYMLRKGRTPEFLKQQKLERAH